MAGIIPYFLFLQLLRHFIQELVILSRFAEHLNAFSEAKVTVAAPVVHAADTAKDDPVPHNFFPGNEQGMFGIVYVGGFGTRAIHFDNGKIFPLLQQLPAFITDIEPAKIKLGNFLAKRVDHVGERLVCQVRIVEKLRAARMIAIGGNDPLLSCRQHFVQAFAMHAVQPCAVSGTRVSPLV